MKLLQAIVLMLFSLQGYAQLQLSAPKPNLPMSTLLVDSDLVKKDRPEPILQSYTKPYQALNQPACIVDSIEVPFNCLYLDANEILNLDVIKNAKYPDGELIIKLKDHKLLSVLQSARPLSLHDLVNTYINVNERSKPVIFLLNKELITDTTGTRIPDVCLAKIVVAKASEIPYFSTALPEVLLMMITTKPISTQPYRQEIIIRGLTASK